MTNMIGMAVYDKTLKNLLFHKKYGIKQHFVKAFWIHKLSILVR